MVKPGEIYKTNAKTKFGLSDEDLSYLVAKKTRNPHPQYRNMPAYLYKEDEIKILARAIHGNLETYNENRKVKAEDRLAKKQEREAQRQREQDARKAVLSDALRVFGLNILTYDLQSPRFAAYLQDGQGDPNQIAIVMNEKSFFPRSTRYSEILTELYRATLQRREYPYDVEEISRNAQNQALEEWVRAFPSREAALADPNLPESLKDRVRQIEMNE